jgi:hypothetical protein
MVGLNDEQDLPLTLVRTSLQLPLTIIALEDLSRQLEGAWGALRLSFRTPLKLMRHGRPLQQFDGAHLLRVLLRRISSLAHHYCHHEFDVDYGKLAELAGVVSCDASGIQRRRIGSQETGFLGELMLRGDLSPLYPFLAAGAVCHVGKGATNGYGCYEILADS